MSGVLIWCHWSYCLALVDTVSCLQDTMASCSLLSPETSDRLILVDTWPCSSPACFLDSEGIWRAPVTILIHFPNGFRLIPDFLLKLVVNQTEKVFLLIDGSKQSFNNFSDWSIFPMLRGRFFVQWKWTIYVKEYSHEILWKKLCQSWNESLRIIVFFTIYIDDRRKFWVKTRKFEVKITVFVKMT